MVLELKQELHDIRMYDAEEVTVIKTIGSGGENVVWERCTHAVLWTTISETLTHCMYCTDIMAFWILINAQQTVTTYQKVGGAISTGIACGRKEEAKSLCGENVRPLNLQGVLRNVHVVNSWRAPTIYIYRDSAVQLCQ